MAAGQPSNGWAAQLELRFEPDPDGSGKTLLFPKHLGPLRIQKALYPEGPDLCQAIIVHPPGGIAAGDELEINVHLPADTQALVTTPGAAKWYGSSGGAACQSIRLDISGRLEWLPQESIIFNQAVVQSQLDINVAGQAATIGWDHLIFGRQASGESFDEGHFFQTLNLSIGHAPIWSERLSLSGADPLFQSPIGLRGHHALATIWAVSDDKAPWTTENVESLRMACPETAWTRLHPRLVVGRLLGPAEALKQHLVSAWTALRPMALGRTAVPPRIWAT